MARLLLAEDDDAVREMLQTALERDGFDVVAVPGVRHALRRIATEKFDVLLSDLHMPHPGDGFTVVSAMRHTHPKALTLLLSGHPELDEAMLAIRSQADDVLVKPIEIALVGEIIQKKLASRTPQEARPKQTVASVLEQELDATIRSWVRLVEDNEELTCIPLDFGHRIGHLPNLLADLISCLLVPLVPNGRVSTSAREHGALRRKQGYTPAMLVEEFRILQISLFDTLQNNLRKVNFSAVLRDAITIADEVDLQLKQAMISFIGDGAQWWAAWNAEPSKPTFQTRSAGILSGSKRLQE